VALSNQRRNLCLLSNTDHEGSVTSAQKKLTKQNKTGDKKMFELMKNRNKNPDCAFSAVLGKTKQEVKTDGS